MDAYDRKARLYPAACVILPFTLLALMLFSLPQWWSGLIGFLAAGGLHVPVVLAVRDLGTRKQPGLWASWGGAPTTVRLRWATAQNHLLQQERHADVQSATGIPMPTQSEEAANPDAADAAYEAAADRLRQGTRNEQDFPLVKTELTNYGYRRNLYGCRAIGIGVALLALVAEVILAVLGWRETIDVPPALMLAAGVVSLLWTLGWVFLVTPDFVRRDADRYADSLISAASALPAKSK